jgi:hypothetical protein
MFVCRWYALLLARSINTQFALCEAWRGALDVTGRRFIAMAGRLQLKSADGVAARKTAGSIALHWGSLDGACGSVKPDEARELIWLVPTKVFADLLLSLVSLRLTERDARTAPVYRAVTWIPICVSVTWSPKLSSCGRFPWEAPILSSLYNLFF